MRQIDPSVALPLDQVGLVRGEHEDPRVVDHLPQPLLGLYPKIGIADRHPLVHDQDVGMDGRCDRKRESHQHPGGVGPHRDRQIVTEAAELGDLRRDCLDGRQPHAGDQAAQTDVFVARGVHLDAEHRVDEAGNRAGSFDPSPCGRVDAGDHPQKRRFARAVVPHDAEPVALSQFERDVTQRTHDRYSCFPADPATGGGCRQRVLQRKRLGPEDRVFDRHVIKQQMRHGITPSRRDAADSRGRRPRRWRC